MPKRKLVIIADDLTGAMDSSGYLASLGLSVIVHFGRKLEASADVTVINTNSRRDPPSLAGAKLKGIAQRLTGQIIFKKIDSTLRGNIAPELTAIMEVLSYEKAIVAPAFPAAGRTVVNGVLLVGGKPVAQTDFAHDPVSPVRESHIPSLLRLNTDYTIGTVTLEDIARGSESLSREFSIRAERILVCDASDQRHLSIIARASSLLDNRLLLSGSGGLARELHLLLGGTTGRNSSQVRSHLSGPALIVVGSRHSVTAGQLVKAQSERHLPLLHLKTDDIVNNTRKSLEISRLVSQGVSCLEKGQSVAITSTFSRYNPPLSQEIVAALAETASAVLASGKVRGLFLSGGDTAMAICSRLNASMVQVYGEIEPGIPAGEVIYRRNRLNLVTKAGAFGEETAIVKSMSYLERGDL